MNLREPWIVLLATIAIASLLAIAGCSEEPETGRAHLVLTDAPYPVDMIYSAQVTIEAISVHVSGDESGWYDLPFTQRTFELLELQNGVTAELIDAELPVGSLNEVRLLVTSGRVLLADGRSFDLSVPSGSSSGLKFKIQPPIAVEGDLTSEVLLDMDVSRSFLPQPALPTKVEEIREFYFRPVVRVANLTTTGSVSGYVISNFGTPVREDDEPLVDATVRFHAGSDTSTTFTDEAGYFQVLGLAAGTWQVEAEASGHAPGTTSIEVLPGIVTESDSLRLSLLPGSD
jgi:hypothetical protein